MGGPAGEAVRPAGPAGLTLGADPRRAPDFDYRVEVHQRGTFVVAWYRSWNRAAAEARTWTEGGAHVLVSGWPRDAARACVDDPAPGTETFNV